MRYLLAASVADCRRRVVEPVLGHHQLGDGPDVLVALTGQARPLERNRVALRVVFVVGRVGVGRGREVDKVHGERVDERLQATSLGNDPDAHRIASSFDAVHGTIVVHCRALSCIVVIVVIVVIVATFPVAWKRAAQHDT